MASVPFRSKQKIHFFLAILIVTVTASASVDDFAPEFTAIEHVHTIDNLRVNNADIKKIIFEVRGRNLMTNMHIRATEKVAEKDSLCGNQKEPFNLTTIWMNEFVEARYELHVLKSFQGNLYFCLPHANRDVDVSKSIFFKGQPAHLNTWHHQGPKIFLNISSSSTPSSTLHKELYRSRRQDSGSLRVTAIRLHASYKEADLDEEGIPSVLANKEHEIRLFGENLAPDMSITFTPESGSYGDSCSFHIVKKGFPVSKGSFTNSSLLIKINLPPIPSETESFFICAKIGNASGYVHQGQASWLQLKTYEKLVPVWAGIIIIVTCLSFSALFSGLNLGLMSMDKTELKILCNTGTSQERKYAEVIQPVRNHGNYLLCSILLGNVFVNSIFTILLDDLTSGLIAVICSTIAIVLFGEITPQAICSRHGLAVGARTILITKFVMVITFPLSYPVSKFLDCILGEEIGSVYNRERLKELVKVTTGSGSNDLDKDEVNIISGALELRKKTVAEVMTRIEDVFSLDYEAVLDFETVSEIMKSGYSRIPVFEANRQNIVTMLYIKDLAFVDPDDNTPLKTLCQFYQNPCNFVFEDVTLDVMFRIFKEGNKGHMAFVHRVNNEGEGDPFYETVGLITLEDVIEELIQAEIMDETDVFTDNRSKRKRTAATRQDFTVFAERRGESSRVRISPQLTLAAFQFLSTSVEQFHPNVISETIMRRLLKQDIAFHVKKNKDWRNDPLTIIYQQGKAVDYFVIILEGRVEVTVGRENLMYEGGPFTFFGTQALQQAVGIVESPTVAASAMGSLESLNLDSMLRHSFQPDYSVRACTEVLYLKIKRCMYLAAKRATLMEKAKKDNNQTGEQYDEEVDKLLHSLDEDDAVSLGRHTPRKRSSKNLSHHGMPLAPQETTSGSKSANTSPKTPSHYSNASPPHRISLRDVNGSIKSSPVDEINVSTRDEMVSLLPSKS